MGKMGQSHLIKKELLVKTVRPPVTPTASPMTITDTYICH